MLQTAVLPPPKLYRSPPARGYCGEVVGVRRCALYTNQPGDCDYVVEMRIERPAADIGFVWFGGRLYLNSHANVDKLTYTVP